MDEQSREAIGDRLNSFGEFVPVTIDKKKNYLFICLTFGAEDEDKCIYEYEGDTRVDVEKLVFDESDIQDKLLFKSKSQFGESLFCGDAFKELCDEAGLKGLVFDENLLSIF